MRPPVSRWVLSFAFVLAALVAGCLPQPQPPAQSPPPEQAEPTFSLPEPVEPALPEPHTAVRPAPPKPPVAQPDDPTPPEFKIIFFDEDQSIIPLQSRPAVLYDAAVLNRHPHLTVLISGHCDRLGPERYNLELGWQRAEAVADAFERSGVARSRLWIVSRGKDEPLELDYKPDARTTNRATVVEER